MIADFVPKVLFHSLEYILVLDEVRGQERTYSNILVGFHDELDFGTVDVMGGCVAR